jgi:hypothetical protein
VLREVRNIGASVRAKLLSQVLEDLRRFLVPLMTPGKSALYWPTGGPWSDRTPN